jgi:hypothetical protein
MINQHIYFNIYHTLYIAFIDRFPNTKPRPNEPMLFYQQSVEKKENNV